MISLEYLAGFFDGEGCVILAQNGRRRTSLTVRMQLTNTNLVVLSKIQESFGGYLSKPFIPKNPKHRLRYLLIWYGNNAVELLEKLKPFLVIKVPQVELAIAFQNIVNHRKPKKPLGKIELLENLKFHEIITKINAGPAARPRGLDFIKRVLSDCEVN